MVDCMDLMAQSIGVKDADETEEISMIIPWAITLMLRMLVGRSIRARIWSVGWRDEGSAH